MAEVALQRVAVDDDPVLVVFAGDAVAEVLAVGVHLGAAIGDDDRDLGQHRLEFLGQPVDRVDDQGLELVEVGYRLGIGHRLTVVIGARRLDRPSPSNYPLPTGRGAGPHGIADYS